MGRYYIKEEIMADLVYTTKEVAERLKITPMTVTRFLKSGRMQGFRVGNQWRITQSALLEFIQRETFGGR
jgi:excisionase family DNA binding protein